MMAQPFEDFYREIEEKGIEKGMEKGIEMGKEEERRKIVSLLIESGMTIDEVAKRLDMRISNVVDLNDSNVRQKV